MPDISATWTELPWEYLECAKWEKKTHSSNFFHNFQSIHVSKKNFLIHLLLSAKIFKIFGIHFKCDLLVFQRKHSVLKIKRRCTFLNKKYVPNWELGMSFKVLLTFNFFSMIKTTAKMCLFWGKWCHLQTIVSAGFFSWNIAGWKRLKENWLSWNFNLTL